MAEQIPSVCFKRAAEEMERWGIRPAYLSAVVTDVVKAVFEAKARYDEVMAELEAAPTTYATCRGCGQQTIYPRLCSDCQVDITVGDEAGTFYRTEGIEAAEWEANHG